MNKQTTSKDIKACPSCCLVTINGVITHEKGCPDSHLFTKRKCIWCGSEFEPKSRDQKFCDPECETACMI